MTTFTSVRVFFRAIGFAGVLMIVSTPTLLGQTNNTFPSSGNAGIGTTSPPDTLSMRSTTNGAAVNVSIDAWTNGERGLLLRSNVGGSPYTRWKIGSPATSGGEPGGNVGTDFGIERFNDSGTSQGYPFFIQRGSGNVGIGTNNPQRSLQVTAANAVGILDGNSQYELYINQSNTYARIGPTYRAGGAFVPLTFWTSDTERVRIDTSGNLGLGTTNPTYPLHVSRSATDQYLGWFENTQSSPGVARLRVQNTASQGSFEIDVTTDGSTFFQTGKTANSPNLSILSGNVGIGTTTPYTKLQVVGGDISIDADHAIRKAGDNSIVAYSTGLPGIILGSGAPTDQVIVNSGGSEKLRILTNGNVGIGTNNPGYRLDVNGTINSNSTITGNNIVAKYQDVAEWVPSSAQLAPGTVVVLDATKSNQVTSSTTAYDTRVAGVVSEQPGIALGEKSEGKVLVATTGRVRVQVDASKSPIHIGDLLVTSDIPGVAMKSEPVEFAGRKMHMPGTLIGKALEPLEKGKGTILVLLSLQ